MSSVSVSFFRYTVQSRRTVPAYRSMALFTSCSLRIAPPRSRLLPAPSPSAAVAVTIACAVLGADPGDSVVTDPVAVGVHKADPAAVVADAIAVGIQMGTDAGAIVVTNAIVVGVHVIVAMSLAVAAPLMPLSQAMVDELGVDNVKSMQNTDMWYNGPYLITEFIQGNSKTLTRNEAYYDKDCTLFDSVTVLMVDDALMGQTLFFNGDVDTCSLSESNLHTIYDDANHELRGNLVEDRAAKYSYTIHLNYGKRLEDGTPDVNWNTAIANEAFRQSLYYGLDLTRFWARTNYIHPEKLENVAYTMKNLLYFSDGTDYVEHVWEKIGLPEGKGRYDAVKAQQYKEQAMEELAGKVTFPVQLDHYIKASDQNALDQATVIKEMVEALGTDFITVNIKTFVSSVSKEVYTPQLNSWSFSGWGADYADPQNFLGQQCYKTDGAYYEANYSHYNSTDNPELIATLEEFTKMVKDADAITDDMDARYEAYAQAEAFLLDHAIVIPTSYSVSVGMTKSNVWAQKYASYGAQNGMYKNYITNAEAPFTTEQMDQFEADYNEGLY